MDKKKLLVGLATATAIVGANSVKADETATVD